MLRRLIKDIHLDPTHETPESCEGLVLLSKYQKKQGRPGSSSELIQEHLQRANEKLSVAIKLGYKNAAAYQLRGESNLKLGQLSDARKDFSTAIHLDPTDATLFNDRGNVFNLEKKWQQSHADHSAAIIVQKNNPKKTDSAVFLANLYAVSAQYHYDQENCQIASRDFSVAIHLDPTNPGHYHGRGLALSSPDEDKEDNPATSLADYTTAIALHRWRYGEDDSHGLATIYADRGNDYYEQGKFKHAAQDFSAAIQHDPLKTVYVTHKANCYRERGKLEKAHKYYTSALLLFKSNESLDKAKTYLDQGIAYNKEKKYEQASQSFERALALNPDEETAHYFLGQFCYTQNKLDEALKHLQQAIKLDPEYAEAFFTLSVVYYHMSELSEARKSIKKAINLGYTSADAYHLLGDVYKQQGEPTKAQENFSIASKRYTERGKDYRKQHDYIKAHHDFVVAKFLDPRNADAQKCYDAMKKYCTKEMRDNERALEKQLLESQKPQDKHVTRGLSR